MVVFIYNSYINNQEKQKGEIKNVVKVNSNLNETLKIYYIDVGQADSSLISYNDKYILIDAGNEEDGEKLVEYFKKLSIEKFDYVFATHPHEDHIGGMDDIISNFKIDNFLMPNVLTTTKTFENMLNALEKNNLGYKVPKINNEYNIDNLNIKVLYIDDNSKDLNDDSIVLKLTFGKDSFLFMGDASKKVEKNILNSDIKSDVLKVGHHGSSYSSSSEFVDKVNPKYAMISVGLNNKYNHPTQSVIDLFNKKNILIYRTDKDGTIILDCDGENINIKKEVTETNG